MTTFWWAKALKKSHLEQARAHIHYAARYEKNRRDLELGFGHMRAIVAVESAVEVAPGTMRDIRYKNLDHTTLEAIATMMAQFNEGTMEGSVCAFLLTFDEWEEKNLSILNC